MEICEPIDHLHPTSTYLDYGLTATVVASLKNKTDAGKIVNISKVSTNDIEFQGAVGPLNHVYSYAYYEPDVQCHSNISQRKMKMIETCKNWHIYSGRNLLAKEFRSKASYEESASLSLKDRHINTTHYGTTENLYEEVSEKNIRKVFSDNRVSTSANCVKEELLRVQHNHFRVLEELNLSLEALIMPPNLSSNLVKTTESFVHCRSVGTGFSSAVVPSNKVLPQNVILSSHPNKCPNTSLEDISVNLKYNSQQSSNKDEFDEEDLDSGFSGSGVSSGASYNESLRDHKTGGMTKTRSNMSTKTSYCSPSPSIVFTTKKNTTSQQAISVVNKIISEDLLQRKTGHDIISLHDTHRYLDTHHLYIRSKPAAILTNTKSKTNSSEK